MANQGSCGVSIVVDGVVLPEIENDGTTYVAAPSDRDFVIRVTTPSGPRHEVVISVDGLSVMTGEDAEIGERGYVVVEGQLDLPGFRLNDNEVAAFRFGKRNDSYAQLDKPKNVGVIAVEFYSEYQRRPVITDIWATRGRSHPLLIRDKGTEFGDGRDRHVKEVNFPRSHRVADIVIEYAPTAQLRKAGILPAEPVLGSIDDVPGDSLSQ